MSLKSYEDATSTHWSSREQAYSALKLAWGLDVSRLAGRKKGYTAYANKESFGLEMNVLFNIYRFKLAKKRSNLAFTSNTYSRAFPASLPVEEYQRLSLSRIQKLSFFLSFLFFLFRATWLRCREILTLLQQHKRERKTMLDIVHPVSSLSFPWGKLIPS